MELVGKKISDRKLTAYAETLGSYGVRVGLVLNQMSPMGSLTDDQAKELAFVLRDIYQFCDDLNKKVITMHLSISREGITFSYNNDLILWQCWFWLRSSTRAEALFTRTASVFI